MENLSTFVCLVPSKEHTPVQISALLRFTDTEFLALLQASTPSKISHLRTDLAQKHEKLAQKPATELVTKTIARISELLDLIQLSN